MRDRPDVRYAHNGDVAIAYQIFGEGPINLVCVPGFVSNLYWNWDLPEFRRMLTGLGSFARVAIMDRRGVGLSDRLSPKDLPSLEVVMDDILTVMDDAGIERAAAESAKLTAQASKIGKVSPQNGPVLEGVQR